MNDSDKPFACAKEGCKMAFTNEDHLNVHKKKHDMALHLGIDNQNTTVADQTPTPTRFIRNCEEVGLFQDLQNVNPFDETFRKATELAKTGSLHIPDSSNDDTLHTPHIFPHIEDVNNINKFSRNISNEPEFSVTTIDDSLLKLSDKNTNDAILSKLKNNIDIEVLTLSSESEKSERNTFVGNSDPVISSHSTSIANINHDVPTAVPVTISLGNSEIPPAVVNNLSDIIKQNCLSKIESDCEETLKVKLKEVLKNRVKTEESESDDCDAMVIHDIETSPLFTNTVSPRLIKSPKRKNTAKRAIKEKPKKNIDTRKTRKDLLTNIIKSKTDKNEKASKLSSTQTQIERQREVNRAAQIRSREKKKYWINQMETEIQLLKDEKKELWIENQNLKNEILWLKTMLLYHKDCPVARDPQITEEINQLVKVSQEELRKKMEKNPLPKKVVPIRPNPAGIIAVTPVPVARSMLVQVPGSVQKSFSLLASTSTPVPIDSQIAPNPLRPLPTLIAKPQTPTISCEKKLVPTTVTGISKLLPVPPLRPITVKSETTSSKLMIKFSDNTSSPAQSSKYSTRYSARQPKIIKVNNRLKISCKKDKKPVNIKANPNQIITLPNTVLPDDNYFILAKPKNFSKI